MIAGESSFLSHLKANDQFSELKEVMVTRRDKNKVLPKIDQLTH